jgi:RNase P subunit RPR2
MSVALIEDAGDNWKFHDGRLVQKTKLNTCPDCQHFLHFLKCGKILDSRKGITVTCGCKGGIAKEYEGLTVRELIT